MSKKWNRILRTAINEWRPKNKATILSRNDKDSIIVNCVYNILQVWHKGTSGSSTKTSDDTVADPDYIPPRINSNTYKKECMLGELGSSTKKVYE